MVLKRRGRLIINFRAIAKFIGFLFSTFIYCEYIHYYVVIAQCSWPTLERSEEEVPGTITREPLHAMILADTHVLGVINGHWFDKLRREWQMHRAFMTARQLHSPDLIIFLGDLMDEGKWAKPDEFEEYINRFKSIFPITDNETHVIYAPGNHDMGFHYSLYPYIVKRFDDAFKTSSVQLRQISGVNFIIINSMAMHGDDKCFLCPQAEARIKLLSKELECAFGDEEKCHNYYNAKLEKFSKPVILQHFPLYRESDKICDEPDEAPYEEKIIEFRERWECLSSQSTTMLMDRIKPRLVFAGHTHHGCHIEHIVTLFDDSVITVNEYTIPSFSWRNKKNPTFSMLSITSDDYAVYKCHMPNENSICFFYGFSLVFAFYWSLRRKIKLGGFLYTKLTKLMCMT